METPPLQSRVTLRGAAIVTGLLLAVAAFLYVSMRAELESNLDEVLDARAAIAVTLADELPHGPELADRLTALGIPATVRTPDGATIEADPALPRFSQGGVPTTVPHPRVSRTVELDDGSSITVQATRAGVDRTLRRLLILEAIAILAAVLLASVLIGRSTRSALRPLRQVAATAERTAAGRTGERLGPDRPHTELGRLAVAFDDMLDALQAAVDDAVGGEERTRRFLADAAHQLRTPITGVRASVETLLRESDPEQRDRLMGNIVRETGRMGRLVNSLLRIAYLDQGRVPTRAATDLVAVVEEEAERARDLAPHLDISVTVEGSSPTELEVDAAEIRDAVANVLDNARRHASERIDLALAFEGPEVLVRIHDDGPGVAAGAEDLIFERFATLDGRGGSGLGLAIARGAVRAHGGDLTYESGAFLLRLPAGSTGEPGTAPASSSSRTGPG